MVSKERSTNSTFRSVPWKPKHPVNVSNMLVLTLWPLTDASSQFYFVRVPSVWYWLLHTPPPLFSSIFWQPQTSCDHSSKKLLHTPEPLGNTLWWLHRIPLGQLCPKASVSRPRRLLCNSQCIWEFIDVMWYYWRTEKGVLIFHSSAMIKAWIRHKFALV